MAKESAKERRVRELLSIKERLGTLHEKWKAESHQAELIRAVTEGYKRIFIRGGRKSAKTESSLYLAHRIANSGYGKVASIIGPSLKQQRKIVWNNRRLPDFAPKNWTGTIREAESMVRFPWKSFIEVDGSENSESHRGEEQDLLVLDELKDHTVDSYDAMYPNLAARDGILVVMGTPPKHKNNLYYKLELEAHRNPAWKFFHWRCWDNATPEGKVPREWLEQEKQAHYARGDGWLWEVEYEANYVFGGKNAVFSVFDEDKHVWPHDLVVATIEKDLNHLDYFIVTDPGNRICHATLFIAYDKRNNYVYVLDEHYEQEQAQTATPTIVPRILEKAEEVFPKGVVPYWIYDEAALWFATEVGAQFPESPPLIPTNKAVKDKEVSMGVIKGCMAKEKYVQSDRCVNLLDEILSYYLEDGKYPKIKDHAIDDLRYFYDFVDYNIHLDVAKGPPKVEPSHKGLLKKVPSGWDDDLDYLLDEQDLWT
jgi:hypothetical protein